jgi:hypothetical protein
VSGIHIIQREHGAAIQQVTRGQRLESEAFEIDAGGGFGAAGEEGDGQQKADEREQKQQRPPEMAAGVGEKQEGNRHSDVSVLSVLS